MADVNDTSLQRFVGLVLELISKPQFIQEPAHYAMQSAAEKAKIMQPIADACNEAQFELERYVNLLKRMSNS